MKILKFEQLVGIFLQEQVSANGVSVKLQILSDAWSQPDARKIKRNTNKKNICIIYDDLHREVEGEPRITHGMFFSPVLSLLGLKVFYFFLRKLLAMKVDWSFWGWEAINREKWGLTSLHQLRQTGCLVAGDSSIPTTYGSWN